MDLHSFTASVMTPGVRTAWIIEEYDGEHR
jgi:hypothetical protein